MKVARRLDCMQLLLDLAFGLRFALKRARSSIPREKRGVWPVATATGCGDGV